MKFILYAAFFLFISIPILGFIQGLGYTKNDNEYLNSARWIDGK